MSRPHSLGKSHTNLGTQLTDIKNMYKDNLKYFPIVKVIQFKLYCYFSVDLVINGCSLIQLLRVFSGLFMPSVVMLERAHLVAHVSSH